MSCHPTIVLPTFLLLLTLAACRVAGDGAAEIPDVEEEIAALGAAAEAAVERGEPEAALAPLERALTAARRLDDSRLEASVHTSLAQVHGRLGAEAARAAEIYHYHQAVAGFRRAGERAATANLLNALGLAYVEAGVSGRAEAALDEALVLARELGQVETERAVLQTRLVARKQALDPRGQVEAAEALLELAERTGDSELAATATTALEEARVLVDAFGDPQLAEALGDAPGLEGWLDGTRQGLEGFALRDLGWTFAERGDTAGALELFQESLELARRLDDAQGAAMALEALSALHVGLGETARAEAILAELWALAQKRNDGRLAARAERLLADALLAGGEVDRAAAALRRSLSLTAERDSELEAAAEGTLGLLAWARGDGPGAIEHWRRAVELEGAGASAGPGLAPLLQNLAWVHASLGEIDPARARLEQASRVVDATGGGGYDRWLLATTGGYVAWRAGRLGDAAAELSRAIAEHEDLWQALGEAETVKVSRQDFAAVPFELLQRVLVEQGEVEEALAAAERGRGRAFAEAVARRGRAPGPAAPPAVGAIRRLARESRATLLIYSILHDPSALLVAGRIGGTQEDLEERLLIWVVPPRGEIRLATVDLTSLRLGPCPTSLARRVRESRERITGGGRGATAVSEGAAEPGSSSCPRATLEDLAALLLDPVDEHLPGEAGARVVVVPHGPLALVPFAALPGPDGRALVERFTLQTSPSLAVVQALPGSRRRQGWRPEAPLVVGDPDLPAGLDLPRLPGAAREAQAVAGLFGASALLGEAARQGDIVRALPRAGLIHLATHGLLEHRGAGLDREVPGALAFGSDEGDGLLTAGEIAGIPLRADLAVLSACDTGGGRLTGDGVVGLARAFLTAGAGSVAVSLWKVDDEATTFLMERFYRRLIAGDDGPRALRQAMLETRETHPDPRLWAPFTFVGGLEGR